MLRCTGSLGAGEYSRNQLISRGTEVSCESLKGDAFVKTSIYLFLFKEKLEVLPQTDVLEGGRSLRSPSILVRPIIKVTVWLI